MHIVGSMNTPYTTPQILNTAYNLLHQTGTYQEAHKEWRKKRAATKTWPNFKTHFMTAYADMMEDSTAGNTGFAQANAASEEESQEDLKTAIEHLANAAIHDKTAVANLALANKTLTQQVKEMQEQMSQLMQHLNSNNRPQPKASLHGHKPKKCFYCWSHGITLTPRHTSVKCLNPSEGHDKEATLTNMKGGKKQVYFGVD